MRIRIISDLHLNSGSKCPGVDSIFKKTSDVIIIAGDVSEDPFRVCNYLIALREQTNTDIIYILGNHEYWGKELYTTPDIFRMILKNRDPFNKIFLLEGNSIVLGGVQFIGSTLWSEILENYEKYYELLPEFFTVKKEEDFISIPDWNLIYKKSKTSIAAECIKYLGKNLKRVIISHHAPSFKSIAPEFKNSDFNYAWVSDMDDFIKRFKPLLWVHGHTHNSFDYTIEDTRVICNPRGFMDTMDTMGNCENPKFDPDFVIDI